MAGRTIDLENVGPIKRLAVPVPDGGGVVVLKGPNGCGKTHGVNAVAGLTRPDVRRGLRASDGVPSGKIAGFGLTVRLGRSNTARGELECQSLDSSCDPSVLVDPGLKDSDAADRKRLGTLVRLAGLKLAAEDWAAMFAGMEELREHVDLEAMAGDDPVQTADRIRRRLHELALKEERLGVTADQEAEATMRTVEDVDLGAEADEAVLRARYEQIHEELIIGRQKRAAAEKARTIAEQARQSLAHAEAKYSGQPVEEARRRVDAATAAVQRADQIVQAAKDALRQAEHEAKLAAAELRAATGAANEARNHEALVGQWREHLQAAVPEAPADRVLDLLAQDLEEAKAAMELGAMVRAARRRQQEAADLKEQAAGFAQRAQRLRDLARSTDSVLETALERAGFCRVKVHDGRLCVDSDRGLEPVSDLSHGERWRLALDLAASGLGKGSLLAVCQEAWESLDPDNRRYVAGLAKDRGLVIVTAEATDGPLRAEEFQAA